MASLCETSARTVMAATPVWRSSSARFLASSARSRKLMAIVAPAAANALDIAAPMPREPPVTSAVRPRKPLLIALSAIGKHCTLVGRAVTASSAQNFLQFGGALAERRGAQEKKRKMFGNLS